MIASALVSAGVALVYILSPPGNLPALPDRVVPIIMGGDSKVQSISDAVRIVETDVGYLNLPVCSNDAVYQARGWRARWVAREPVAAQRGQPWGRRLR